MKKISNAKNWVSKYAAILVVCLSTLLSIGSLIYYMNQGLTLAYNDAESHLNIARRVVDSLTPGLVQIGSTWLPLLHILELPLIWNTYLWHTGLAGSIVSMVSYVCSCYFIFKAIELLTRDKFSSFLGVAIFWANANMLYMQTVAMFEPLLIVTMLGTIYFLMKWIKTDKVPDLLYSALFAMLSSLSRYDGWALLVATVLYVFIYALHYKKFNIAKGLIVFYGTLAGFGIFLWLLYNYLIFKSPFYFANNEFSAWSQQLLLASRHSLFTKGNLLLSIKVFFSAVFLNQGVLFSFLGILGLIFYLLKNNINIKSWVTYLFLVPLAFNIFALFKGDSVIWIPNFPPYFKTFFNIRYGLLLLPAVAVFSGYLTMHSLWKKIIVVGAIVVQIVLFYSFLPGRTDHLSFVLLRDTVASINAPTLEATDWLKNNYQGGLILISSASSETFLFHSGLDLKNFITEGTGHFWFESLKNPASHAQYIVVFSSFTDRVGKALKDNTVLNNQYRLVYQNPTYFIYQKSKYSLANEALNSVTKNSLWSIQSVDTMKTSRDEARYFNTSPTYKDRVNKELKLIKQMGANYVAIGTPYDKEFLPVLKYWADSAHSIGLHVWFRGNFSSWEGWFNYPKNLTSSQHLQLTAQFIRDNPSLFLDGDSFTPAPEAENGGPWKPVEPNQFEAYRTFLRNEYDTCKSSFGKLGKNITCNWLSMNGDVANNVIDRKTADYLGGLITIDHYVKNESVMKTYIESIHNKLGAKILIGEFGAPLDTINQPMTDNEQADFISQILDLLSQKDYIVGFNYWVLTGGSTALTTDSLEPKRALVSLEQYFKPGILESTVVDGNKHPIQSAEIYYKDKKVLTDSNGKATLYIPSGVRNIYVHKGKLSSSMATYIQIGGTTRYTTVLSPDNSSPFTSANPEEYEILKRITNK